MKALEILYKIDTEYKYASLNTDSCVRSTYVYEAIAELQALENRSCNNCKNASFEVKFGELEFNACFLVSNGNICKWESK